MTAPTRIEVDSLGACEVPADALYGVRTVRILTHLSFSGRTLGSSPTFVAALAQVKRAAAQANAAAGVLDPELAAAIDRACTQLPRPELAAHLPVDLLAGGGAIGINVNINEVIANLANEDLGGRRGTYRPIDPARHVNASQSTADICHSSARLALLAAADPLMTAIAAADLALDNFIARCGDMPTLARTCLRDALPTTVSTLFAGHRALLQRRAAAVAAALAPLNGVVLGGTVIGTGDGAPPRYRDRVVGELAAITGRPLRRSTHPSSALQNSDDVVALSAALAQLAQAFIKITQDVRLLASGPKGGFGELLLPHVHEGSSFFPGKVNPSVAETLLQCAFQMLGCHRVAEEAARAAELHLNVFDTQVALNALDALQMAAPALERFTTSVLAQLDIDTERCRLLVPATTEATN